MTEVQINKQRITENIFSFYDSCFINSSNSARRVFNCSSSCETCSSNCVIAALLELLELDGASSSYDSSSNSANRWIYRTSFWPARFDNCLIYKGSEALNF